VKVGEGHAKKEKDFGVICAYFQDAL